MTLLGKVLSNSSLCSGITYSCYREIPVTISYSAGRSIEVLVNWSAFQPTNSNIYALTKLNSGEWILCPKNEPVAINPGGISPGSNTVTIKIVLTTTDLRSVPYLLSENITITQRITLANLARNVLEDAELTEITDYIINNNELYEYIIPYPWIGKKSHRDALLQIVTACCGNTYCDRYGIVQVQGPSFLEEDKTISVATLTEDDYFSKTSQTGDIFNYVEVPYMSYTPASAATEVYSSSAFYTIPETGSKEIDCEFTSTPVISAAATITDDTSGSCVISVANYYAWGSKLTVTGPAGQTFKISISGTVLTQGNKEIVFVKDDQSILLNGKRVYTFPENELIQTEDMALKIANNLLNGYKNGKQIKSINWQGDLSLELSDLITVPQFKTTNCDMHITRQQIIYENGLNTTTEGVKK